MKKIKNKFFSLSLAKQLFILLGAIFLVILCVIHPYINSKLEKIAENQIYESISQQQNQLIDMIENVDNWTLTDRIRIDNQLDGDMKVHHLLFYSQTSGVEILTKMQSREASQLTEKIFYPLVLEMMENGETQRVGYFSEINDEYVYYKITESPSVEGVYWISFERSEISSELLTEIRSELVNVLYIVILLVALLLITWIYSIINPLKDIITYIQAIKQSKSYQLTLERNDEIGEVGQALVDMEKELNIQKELQEELIHNISHDLKTPITIIKSYSESMKDDIYPYGDKNSSLDIIIENTDRLEKKVKDFLLLNRLDYLKNQNKTTQTTSMKDLIETILKEIEPIHPELKFNVELQEMTFQGEEDHWRSCITNILENALRYASSTIEIHLNEDGLSIFNDGQLLDEDILKDMFKPYKKGPNGNFGLGMSIVYKIVTMYGYSITPMNLENGVQFKIAKV